MPNYTTNLNLEKPLQSEQYNIDVFNANADKIDQFAGQVPARALTADKLTTGAKINGVNFKGDTDITIYDETKANIDLLNLTSTGENHFLNKRQITNCILEAPNGVGYTDTTNFYVPSGVKVLAPNGRNQDNTLKNIELTTTQKLSYALVTSNEGTRRLVFLNSSSSTMQIVEKNVLYVHSYGSLPSSLSNTMGYLAYSFIDNRWYSTSGSTTPNWQPIIVVPLYFYSTKPSYTTAPETTSYQSLQLLHRGDKNEISGWGMPSGKYIDLTLGASGSTYIAPANGWFILSYTTTSDDSFAGLGARALTSEAHTSKSSQYGSINVPCCKGQTCWVNYRNITKRNFRFIYAEGEVT